MRYGMIIDMQNKNALITNAMLASYINRKHMDYLNMLEPFVLKELPLQINSIVNIESLTKNVNSEYGLDIKYKVVEKILNRLSKDKHGNIIKRQTNESTHSSKTYYLNKNVDNSDFDSRKAKMASLVQEVVEKLKNYIIENYRIFDLTYDEAQKYLIDFLEDYNYELYSTANNLRKIQGIEKHNSNNFRVAKFIISEHEKKTGCFNKIREIQAGYFAQVALYYFCNAEKDFNPSKIIDKTAIIFDTRLLIDILGLNKSYETESMKELLELIQKHGGILCTFDYYVDELDGIIKKYLNDKNARIKLDLDFFSRTKTTPVEIALYRKNLRNIIENEKHIKILKETDYSELINNSSWHIDVLELKKNMMKYIEYQYGESDFAFENDFNSLQTVSFYKFNYLNTGSNNVIFVTSNSGLINAARSSFDNQIFHDDIDLLTSDINLTATLWLSDYNAGNNLPDLILLENAYAAICPTKDILNEALQIIDRLSLNKDETIRNNAFLLRYDEFLTNEIADITANDKTKVTDSLYDELLHRMQNRIRKETITQEREKIFNEVQDNLNTQYKEKLQELNIREKTIEEQERAFNSEKENTELLKHDIMEARLLYDSKIDELNLKKNENDKLITKQDEIIEHEIKKIGIISKIISNIFQVILSLGMTFVMIYILYVLIISALELLSNGGNILSISNQVIGIVSGILTFCPVLLFSLKITKKLSNRIYDFIYSKLYKHSYILNKID